MPSIIAGNASGGDLLVSGNFWSGRGQTVPLDGVQVVWDPQASGYGYIAFSGGITIRSGGYSNIATSGWLSGILDGLPLTPGGSYFVPKSKCGISGTLSIYVTADLAASGQAHWFWEAY